MKKIYNTIIISTFIVIQPLLDVLTYFSTSKLGFSIGLIMRGLFIIYSLVYLIFFGRNKRINLIFSIIIFVYLLGYLVFNCSNIGIFIYKIPSLFKFLYFPVITLFLYENYNI